MDDESAAAFRDICGFPRLNNPLLTVIYCMTGTSGLLFLGFLSPSTLKHVTDSFRSVYAYQRRKNLQGMRPCKKKENVGVPKSYAT